jgi:aminoglycoside 3-N-acetyltransferase
MITRKELSDLLTALGIKSGDTILVHSDLRGFGLPENAKSREEILQFYFDGITSHIGSKGTLAVPAYFYEYSRQGIPFDVDRSPVSAPLGAFSQWVAAHPKSVRSCNPLQSIAACGEQAHELAGGLSLSGYGVDSPWHKLRLLGGKMIFLGTPIQTMTFVHYIEQQCGVPHLYFKLFSQPVIKSGKQLPGFPISAVRYLDYSIVYLLDRYQERLQAAGVLRSGAHHSLLSYAVDAEDAFRIGVAGLAEDPFFFLKQPPDFIPGKIPTDTVKGASR